MPKPIIIDKATAPKAQGKYEEALLAGLKAKLAYFPGWHLGKKQHTRYIYTISGGLRVTQCSYDAKDAGVNLLALHLYMNGAIDATKTPCSKAYYMDTRGLKKLGIPVN